VHALVVLVRWSGQSAGASSPSVSPRSYKVLDGVAAQQKSMNEIVADALAEHPLDEDRRAEIDQLAAGVRRRYRRALDDLAE